MQIAKPITSFNSIVKNRSKTLEYVYIRVIFNQKYSFKPYPFRSPIRLDDRMSVGHVDDLRGDSHISTGDRVRCAAACAAALPARASLSPPRARTCATAAASGSGRSSETAGEEARRLRGGCTTGTTRGSTGR